MLAVYLLVLPYVSNVSASFKTGILRNPSEGPSAYTTVIKGPDRSKIISTVHPGSIRNNIIRGPTSYATIIGPNAFEKFKESPHTNLNHISSGSVVPLNNVHNFQKPSAYLVGNPHPAQENWYETVLKPETISYHKPSLVNLWEIRPGVVQPPKSQVPPEHETDSIHLQGEKLKTIHNPHFILNNLSDLLQVLSLASIFQNQFQVLASENIPNYSYPEWL